MSATLLEVIQAIERVRERVHPDIRVRMTVLRMQLQIDMSLPLGGQDLEITRSIWHHEVEHGRVTVPQAVELMGEAIERSMGVMKVHRPC